MEMILRSLGSMYIYVRNMILLMAHNVKRQKTNKEYDCVLPLNLYVIVDLEESKKFLRLLSGFRLLV